jgi:hypothetical protein
MSKFYINPTDGGELQKQFGTISENTHGPLGFGSGSYRRRLRNVVDTNPVPIRPRGGVTRVVGVKELTYDNELLIEVEVLIDQNEYAVLHEEIYGGVSPGAEFPQFSSVEQLLLALDRDPVLRDYMRHWPVVGYQYGSVPAIRGLLEDNDLKVDQWHQIIAAWREGSYATEANPDGTKLHARYNERCPLCRKRLGMYTDSVQRKMVQSFKRQAETPGWACGWPIRPIELSSGPRAYVGVAALSRLARGQYYSKSWMQYHLADLANVVIRVYNDQIIDAVKNRFEHSGLEPNSPLAEIVYGTADNPRIEVIPPEDMDPRFFTKVNSMQHNVFALPDFVAVALQSTYYTFNALVKLNLDRGPSSEEAGEPPSFIQYIQSITRNALRLDQEGADPEAGLQPWDTVVTKAGQKVNIYQVPLAAHTKIPVRGLNFLFDSFAPSKYSNARGGPIDWGVAGRGDTWFIDTSGDEIFGLEDRGLTLAPWSQNAPFPIDDEGNLYVCDDRINDQDVSELSFIYDEPTNTGMDKAAAERIRHMLRVMPSPEELAQIKQTRGAVYTDFTGRFGKPGVQYDWSHPALWLDVERIAELEMPPPYVDNEGRYVPIEAFPKIRELYNRLNHPQSTPEEKRSADEQIRRIVKGYQGHTYSWDDITGYDPNTETHLRPNHPVLMIPTKQGDVTFKSILADAKFDQWLISDPTLVKSRDRTGGEMHQWDYSTGAGCEYDESVGAWRARYIDPKTKKRIPWSSGALWGRMLSRDIEAIGSEEMANLQQTENNVLEEVARLVEYVPNWMSTIPDYYHDAIQHAIPRVETMSAPEDPEGLLKSYLDVLNRCRSSVRSIKNTVNNAMMDPAKFRVTRFELPIKVPEEAGWEQDIVSTLKKMPGTGRAALIPWSKDWLIAMMQRLTPTGLKRFRKLAAKAIKDRNKLRKAARAHGAAPEDLESIEISVEYKRQLQKLFRVYARKNPALSGPYINFKKTGIIDAPEGYGTKLPPFRNDLGSRRGQEERQKYFTEVVEMSTELFKMIEQGEFLHKIKTLKDPDYSTLADLHVKELTQEIPSARQALQKQFANINAGDLMNLDPGDKSEQEPEVDEPQDEGSSEPDEPDTPDETEVEFEPGDPQPIEGVPLEPPEDAEEMDAMRPLQPTPTPFNVADHPSEPEELSLDDYGHEVDEEDAGEEEDK